jgi:hypothetical protein
MTLPAFFNRLATFLAFFAAFVLNFLAAFFTLPGFFFFFFI